MEIAQGNPQNPLHSIRTMQTHLSFIRSSQWVLKFTHTHRNFRLKCAHRTETLNYSISCQSRHRWRQSCVSLCACCCDVWRKIVWTDVTLVFARQNTIQQTNELTTMKASRQSEIDIKYNPFFVVRRESKSSSRRRARQKTACVVSFDLYA